MTGVSQQAGRSRGDRPELLFGDAAVECGLDGGPSVSDGCWEVVRVSEQAFDELLCMETRSSSSLMDEWDQVYAGVSVELFLFLTFSHVAWAGAMRPACQCNMSVRAS